MSKQNTNKYPVLYKPTLRPNSDFMATQNRSLLKYCHTDNYYTYFRCGNRKVYTKSYTTPNNVERLIGIKV